MIELNLTVLLSCVFPINKHSLCEFIHAETNDFDNITACNVISNDFYIG